MTQTQVVVRKSGGGRKIALFLTAAFIWWAVVPVFGEDAGSIDSLRQIGKTFARIAEKASPAVVGVKVQQRVEGDKYTFRGQPFESPFEGPFGDDFFDHFFRRQMPPRQRQRPTVRPAQGSGFIISADGYILTNNHLVRDAEKVMVKVGDKAEVEAKVIGTDPDSDIAVIKIDTGKELPYLELADSDKLEVGEWVLAIGNPFGLSHSVTAGIVSAKGRSGVGLAAYEDFIQTDAAINPGNSGGPLINLEGKAVGINTAIVSPQAGMWMGSPMAGNIGIGFAIPINMAKGVYSQLIEGGTVVRGFLGVLPQDITPELAEHFGLKDTKGVLIPEVTKDSAAEKAGLKQGDIIVEFDGQPVESAGSFRNRVALTKPGTKVEMVVLRDGERKKLTVELAQRPKELAAGGQPSKTMEELGFTAEELTEELAGRLGYKGLSGVVVTGVEPGSIAAEAGITEGALIMEVNRKAVSSVAEFNEQIEKAREAKSIVLLMRQDRVTRYVVLSGF